MYKINYLHFKLVKTVFYFLVISLMFSCEKEQISIDANPTDTSPEVTSGDPFVVTDGYLQFTTVESFRKTKERIANLSDAERESWEKEQGFLSQRRIMSMIIKQEDIKDQECEAKYKGQDISGIDESNFHSDLYNEYLAKGVIKLYDQGTPNEYWDLSVYYLGMIDFINEDGLFAIGDTLFHVNGNRIMAIANGEFDKKQELMKATMVNTNGFEIVNSKISTKSTSYRSPGYYENVGWVTEGSQRINMRIYIDVLYFIVGGGPAYDFFHDVLVENQKKNWLGKWKYETAETWVNGSWEMSVFANPLILSSTYSWHGYAQYFKSSVNPGSGSTAPYQSYFSVSAPNPTTYEEYYSPIYNSCYWTATRWGGASGITETITK